jgi:hypothetical protein
VLIEEKRGSAGTGKRGGSAGSDAEKGDSTGTAYTEAALADQQPPAIAVLAGRPWTLAVIFLSALAAVVGLHAAYGQLYLLPERMRPAQLPTLDVESVGSLVAWLTSLLLAAAAFQGVQIHRLRRHKTDDYRGRYRVWAWIPLVFLFMSACVVTGLQVDIAALLGSLIDPSGEAGHLRLSPLGSCLLWTLIAVRLAFEIRGSRGSLSALAVATVCYFLAATGSLLEVHPLSHVLLVMGRSSLAAVGHVCVFLAVAVFGRHVYLDAQGLLQRETGSVRDGKATRKKARTSRKRANRNGSGKDAVEIQSEDAPSREISLEAVRQSRAAESVEPADSELAVEKLSKAERRRQRKQKRQQRRAA